MKSIRADAATTILRVSPEDETEAIQVLERYTDKRFSLTDVTSFLLMERRKIGLVFTMDSDFRQYGLQELQPA